MAYAIRPIYANELSVIVPAQSAPDATLISTLMTRHFTTLDYRKPYNWNEDKDTPVDAKDLSACHVQFFVSWNGALRNAMLSDVQNQLFKDHIVISVDYRGRYEIENYGPDSSLSSYLSNYTNYHYTILPTVRSPRNGNINNPYSGICNNYTKICTADASNQKREIEGLIKICLPPKNPATGKELIGDAGEIGCHCYKHSERFPGDLDNIELKHKINILSNMLETINVELINRKLAGQSLTSDWPTNSPEYYEKTAISANGRISVENLGGKQVLVLGINDLNKQLSSILSTHNSSWHYDCIEKRLLSISNEKLNVECMPLDPIDIKKNTPIKADVYQQLSANLKKTMNDCICYSDCNNYSVCYCFGNCDYY